MEIGFFPNKSLPPIVQFCMPRATSVGRKALYLGNDVDGPEASHSK